MQHNNQLFSILRDTAIYPCASYRLGMKHMYKTTTGSHWTVTFPARRAPTSSIWDGWKHCVDTFGRATRADEAITKESTHKNLYCIHIINLHAWNQLPGHWIGPSHASLYFLGQLQTPLGTDHVRLRLKSCQYKLSILRRDTTHGRRMVRWCILW